MRQRHTPHQLSPSSRSRECLTCRVWVCVHLVSDDEDDDVGVDDDDDMHAQVVTVEDLDGLGMGDLVPGGNVTASRRHRRRRGGRTTLRVSTTTGAVVDHRMVTPASTLSSHSPRSPRAQADAFLLHSARPSSASGRGKFWQDNPRGSRTPVASSKSGLASQPIREGRVSLFGSGAPNATPTSTEPPLMVTPAVRRRSSRPTAPVVSRSVTPSPRAGSVLKLATRDQAPRPVFSLPTQGHRRG